MTGKQHWANSFSQNHKANTQSRGAVLAYRVVLWYPELVKHIFTVSVPYSPPMTKNISIEYMVRNLSPHFAYQLQFKSEKVEKAIRSKAEIRQFLIALYGGRTQEGEVGFDANNGVLFDKIGQLKPSRLLSEEVSGLSWFWFGVGVFMLTFFL